MQFGLGFSSCLGPLSLRSIMVGHLQSNKWVICNRPFYIIGLLIQFIKTVHSYTVKRRIPNVRFGKPNKKAFGYRTFGFRTFGSLTVQSTKSNVRISAFFTKLDHFIYKTGQLSEKCRKPNNASLMNRTFEIQTIQFGLQKSFESRTVQQPNDLPKRRNSNVRISNVYCILILNLKWQVASFEQCYDEQSPAISAKMPLDSDVPPPRNPQLENIAAGRTNGDLDFAGSKQDNSAGGRRKGTLVSYISLPLLQN